MEAIIYGAGTLGRIALNILRTNGTLEIIGFIDDDPITCETEIDGLKVIGRGKDLPNFRKFGVEAICVAVHDGKSRLWIARMVENTRYQLLSAIHPKTNISPEATIEAGCIIDEGAIIESGARVGRCCYLGKGAVIKAQCSVPEGTIVRSGEVFEKTKERESIPIT